MMATKGMAAQAYLPNYIKKAVKKRQIDDQMKFIKKHTDLVQKEQQLSMNAQLETAFHKEMANWTGERAEVFESKLKDYED